MPIPGPLPLPDTLKSPGMRSSRSRRSSNFDSAEQSSRRKESPQPNPADSPTKLDNSGIEASKREKSSYTTALENSPNNQFGSLERHGLGSGRRRLRSTYEGKSPGVCDSNRHLYDREGSEREYDMGVGGGSWNSSQQSYRGSAADSGYRYSPANGYMAEKGLDKSSTWSGTDSGASWNAAGSSGPFGSMETSEYGGTGPRKDSLAGRHSQMANMNRENFSSASLSSYGSSR